MQIHESRTHANKILWILLIAMAALFIFASSADAALISCGKGCLKLSADGKQCVQAREGFSLEEAQPCTFCDFFKTGQRILNFMIFQLALPLTGLFFLIGGFLIMVSGITAFTEWTGKSGTQLHSTGVSAITGSVIGVFIVLVAWVFINTLLNSIASSDPRRFPAPWYQIQCQPSAALRPADVVPPEVLRAEETMRAVLAQTGIQVNKNPCPPGKSYGEVAGGCTNVAGLPQTTVDKLQTIARECGCTVRITGGTESGHRSHGPGRPIVDLAYDPKLAEYLQAKRARLDVLKICAAREDAQYRYNCVTVEQQRHLHIEFAL